MERTILHCDLNCFYASVELLSHPELTHLPVAVCGDPESRHGIVLAKNEAAKAMGVKTAETIWQAQKKCPTLVLLAPHQQEYQRYSRLVNGIYERFTDLVEPFGIDESWLDVTGTLHLFGGTGRGVADTLRQVVREELGLTISVGVSFNKVFAKLGSDYKKPDATTVITRQDVAHIVWPLPVTDLLYVGQAAGKTLAQHGVTTIGQLAKFPQDGLVALLGKQGALLHDYANGLEHAPVARAGAYDPPKSVGSGNTFSRNLTRLEEIAAGVSLLTDDVAYRLRRHHLKCGTIQVTLRDPNFKDICRQRPVATPTNLVREIYTLAMEIIAASWRPGDPLRALTITAQNLQPEDQVCHQMDLFGQDEGRREKQETLESAMDGIRIRYGKKAIHFAQVQPKPDKE